MLHHASVIFAPLLANLAYIFCSIFGLTMLASIGLDKSLITKKNLKIVSDLNKIAIKRGQSLSQMAILLGFIK